MPSVAGIVIGEVRRDRGPALSSVRRLVHDVRSGVHDVRVVRRDDDRERPLEAILQVHRRVAHRIVRPRIHVHADPGPQIFPREQVAVAAGVHDVRIVAARGDPTRLAAAGLEPLGYVEVSSARAAERGIILLRAADVIRKMVRRDDVVELRGREVLVRPRLPAVDAHLRTAVVGLDHPLIVLWIDPQVVRVAVVHAAHGPERFPAVGRLHERHVVHVHDVRVLRVGVNLGVVPRALAQIAIVVGALPRRAGVVGAEHAARIGLDVRPDAVRVSARHGDADVPPDPLRQARVACDLRPVISTVGRLEHSAALAA